VRARTATVALLVAAALGTAACGDDKNTTATPAAEAPAATATVQAPDVTVETPTATATATTATPAATATTPAAKTPASSKSISKNLKTKPNIPKPTAKKAPKTLVVKDVVKGKGATAKAGDALTVQYVGVDYKTGEQFDASWDSGQPFQFQLGAQMVIPGWDQGIAGMKVGGRRELVIPPDLAYGPQGQPPAIAPNATLVFVVDLVSIG
jgi:peptidylprolyl isomerase